jgi:hypothetical protein
MTWYLNTLQISLPLKQDNETLTHVVIVWSHKVRKPKKQANRCNDLLE